jgi:hypothetical protein
VVANIAANMRVVILLNGRIILDFFLIVGLLDCWIVFDCWIVGLLDCLIVGLLDCLIVGLLDCLIVGLLDCWMTVGDY